MSLAQESPADSPEVGIPVEWPSIPLPFGVPTDLRLLVSWVAYSALAYSKYASYFEGVKGWIFQSSPLPEVVTC